MSFDNARKAYNKIHLWYIEIEIDGTTWRFCENESSIPAGLDAIPSLISVNTTPSKIDLNGGLGSRAKVSISLKEFVDYSEWGTIQVPARFWARWRAENPYYKGTRVSVFSGYIVDGVYDVSNFIQRDYIFETFAQPTGGTVSITAKDPLKLADNDRAVAPVESSGSLLSDITDTDLSITLQPTGVGDDEYPASNFFVRVGDEVMLCSSRTGDVLTVTRGDYNTTAAEASEGDTVQLCLYYETETVSDITYDLLGYTELDRATYIDKAQWDAEVSNSFNTTYTALITEPKGVNALIKEFAESAPHYLYYDERINKIVLSALNPPPDDALLITYQGNLLKGSTSVKDMQDMRVSTVVTNYGIFDPTKDLDEVSNYRLTRVRIDGDSVTNNQDQQARRVINSRWISADNTTAAVLVNARIGRRFAIAPRQVNFNLDAKDADVWVGDNIKIESDLILEAGTGVPAQLNYQILSAQENINYSYVALEHTYGEALPEDEDAEDPNVRLIFIASEADQLKDDLGNPRTLREYYEDVFGSDPLDPDLDVRFIIDSNGVAGSSDNTAPSIKTGAWTELTTPILIDNRNLIVGRGGNGGVNFGNGGDGGVALYLEDDIRLDNTGIIGGGGGGGGAGLEPDDFGASSQGGGGGAGYFNGSASEGGTSGTNTTGGEGAQSSVSGSISGGDGGDLGQDGGNGGDLSDGGQGGDAIQQNGFAITYINTGDIRGAIVP